MKYSLAYAPAAKDPGFLKGGGGGIRKRRATTYYLATFPKNCMEMKKTGPAEGIFI